MSKWEEIKNRLIKKILKMGYSKDEANSLIENSGIKFMLTISPEIILSIDDETLIKMVLQ